MTSSSVHFHELLTSLKSLLNLNNNRHLLNDWKAGIWTCDGSDCQPRHDHCAKVKRLSPTPGYETLKVGLDWIRVMGFSVWLSPLPTYMGRYVLSPLPTYMGSYVHSPLPTYIGRYVLSDHLASIQDWQIELAKIELSPERKPSVNLDTDFILHYCKPVWPDLAKFCYFGYCLWQFLRVYLIFDKTLWQYQRLDEWISKK